MNSQIKCFIYLTFASCINISIHCYNITLPYNETSNNTMQHSFEVPSTWLNSPTFIDADTFLINTPGCYIPNYLKTFQYKTSRSDDIIENPCGVRAVFVERGANNNKLYFRIDEQAMKKYTIKTKYRCCYKFAFKSITEGTANDNRTELIFTRCKTFKTGSMVPLEFEIIVVSCALRKQRKKEFYSDAYIKVKKLNITRGSNKIDNSWNVLLLGIHAMSRARLFATIPRTAAYLQNHKWLDYKGYQKIGSSTFPNLMPLLTGKNYSTIVAQCGSGLYKCAEYFIWNMFMKAGYVTAYGEDYLNLPNTFSKFGGFRIRPTHHYMRPFYRLGEKRQRNIMCVRRQPSATHLLNYAYEFAQTYTNKRFFGMFWINTYSHDATDDPSRLDKELTRWFLKLTTSGILSNTFVVFLSDHGTKYGDMKLPIESYYDERLPILFIWAPTKFRKQHSQDYTNLLVNQHRLITSYDLHLTLQELLNFTYPSPKQSTGQACPRCTSLFKLKSIHWTCADARVSENACSCRTMTENDKSATETENSLELAVDFINNVTETVSTAPCTTCKQLTLKSILRSHSFKMKDRVYNVIAFEMSSNVRFEATIVYRGDTSRVLYLHTVTAQNKKGYCVLDPSDRPYCDCERHDCEEDNMIAPDPE